MIVACFYRQKQHHEKHKQGHFGNDGSSFFYCLYESIQPGTLLVIGTAQIRQKLKK